jgi:hypothetical protein
MDGPSHFKAAEADARQGDDCFEGDPGGAALYYQSAQVHATLALAAATAVNDPGMWYEATGTRQKADYPRALLEELGEDPL